MRNVQDDIEKLLTLVKLLRETAGLEIHASFCPIEAKLESDDAHLIVHLSGPDAGLLTAANGKLLDALETLAAEVLGLSGAERNSVHFDAEGFLAEQEVRLRRAAETAVGRVRFTGTPFVFPPMNSRERRLLGHALIPSGLCFETLGEDAAGWVVLLPKDVCSELEGAGLRSSATD